MNDASIEKIELSPEEKLKRLVASIQDMFKFSPEFLESFRKGMVELARVIEVARKFPPFLKNSIISLAEEGWYVDLRDMSLREPVELERLYSKGSRDEVQQHLIEHYRKRYPEIELELYDMFPERAEILKQAFFAHRQGYYYLSVPAFLAQADGVYTHYQGKNFFQAGESIKPFNQEMMKHDELTNALLSPFSMSTSIRKGLKQREPGFGYLNRHVVLHGESLDYGTEEKSLQALAFLYYVAIALGTVLERHVTHLDAVKPAP